jgi:hypothetical protein
VKSKASQNYVKALFPPDKKKDYQEEDKLFYCEICKTVYEPYSVNGKLKEKHYKDFPSLHLTRKTCLGCNGVTKV